MKTPHPVCIDFETFGIEPRPAYPPKPVGVSIEYPGGRARYHAFGHPTENDCTEAQAKAALKEAYAWKGGLLFQNAKFDLDVAETHWGLEAPEWSQVHDSMFLIFLHDPNQQTFSLKPAAERILKMKPEERDAVGDWLLERQPVPGVKVSKSQASEHYFGRYIAHAPGKLVGAYANGDVVRTRRIFDRLHRDVVERGMLEAYDRERRLMPHLLRMERQGVPVCADALAKDVAFYRSWLERIDAWVRKELRCSEDVNLDSGEQLFDAMLRAKKVDRKKAPLTATGKYQTNKAALLLSVEDPTLLAVLKYKAQLKTCVGTFMEPWSRTAAASVAAGVVSRALRAEKKSLVFTTWNQVKSDNRGGSAGARTGRLSATLFMNMPKHFAPIFKHEEKDAKRRRALPRCPLKSLPPLPLVRSYVAPFPGDALVDRDYSQQEPRILAHFDGGAIMKMYTDDPWMDFHDRVREELAKVGLVYERKPVKNTGLGLIYGMGIGTLAERTGLDVEEAKKLKAAVLRILVGLKKMYQDCRLRAAEGRPVKTWGGREYFCEPPKIIDGRYRTFEYKLPNVLIQGSAADCTKEAIVRFCEAKSPRTKLLFNVHDQLTASAPRAIARREMEKMRACMESLEFDVRMLTEGSASAVSWAALKDTDKAGVEIDGAWDFLRKAA